MTEPLPCPFCGQVPATGERQSITLTHPPRTHSNVTCENVACHAQPYIADHVSLDEAIKRWNTRARLRPPGLPKDCPDCNGPTDAYDSLDDGLHCRQCGMWLCD